MAHACLYLTNNVHAKYYCSSEVPETRPETKCSDLDMICIDFILVPKLCHQFDAAHCKNVQRFISKGNFSKGLFPKEIFPR